MTWKKSSARKLYTEDTLYEYAVGALARRMRTIAELKRLMRTRISHQPEGEALMDVVIARLKQQRYLNDTTYASSYSASRRDTEKFGRMRVVQELKARGVHPEIIDKAVGESYAGVEEQNLARQFAERKRLQQPTDQKQAARIFRMMARAGFSSRVIMQLLRQWKVEDETLAALEQEREAATDTREEEEP
jgi:regulatory protein